MPRIRTFCISALSPGQQKTFWALTEMKIYTFLPEDRSERIHLDYYIVLNVGATQGYVSPKEHLLLHHAIQWVFLLSKNFIQFYGSCDVLLVYERAKQKTYAGLGSRRIIIGNPYQGFWARIPDGDSYHYSVEKWLIYVTMHPGTQGVPTSRGTQVSEKLCHRTRRASIYMWKL